MPWFGSAAATAAGAECAGGAVPIVEVPAPPSGRPNKNTEVLPEQSPIRLVRGVS